MKSKHTCIWSCRILLLFNIDSCFLSKQQTPNRFLLLSTQFLEKTHFIPLVIHCFLTTSPLVSSPKRSLLFLVLVTAPLSSQKCLPTQLVKAFYLFCKPCEPSDLKLLGQLDKRTWAAGEEFILLLCPEKSLMH